jgi:acyl-CoA reductase-like NAD-dependent aldehyde dehydrogenase
MRVVYKTINRAILQPGVQYPCFVWTETNLDRAVDAIPFEAYRSTGQVYNRVNRVYANEDIYDVPIERIAAQAARIVPGDVSKEGVDIGPLVNGRQLKWISQRGLRIYRQIRPPGNWINDIHGSFVQVPDGGMKQSGIDGEQDSLAIDDYLEWKTVYQKMNDKSRGTRICVHH